MNQQYRLKIIPDLGKIKNKKQKYLTHPIDFDNPLLDEPLVDIKEVKLAGDNYYHRNGNNPPYNQLMPNSIKQLLLRKTVVQKLQFVNQKLSASGLELYIFDAWRPIQLQNYLFDDWFPNWLKMQKPGISQVEVEQETSKYFARGTKSGEPVDPNSLPPHNTGGAIDLTIRIRNIKEHMFMGSIFDDVTEIARTDYFEQLARRRKLNFSEQTAQENRRLLYWVMTEMGFSSNPTEWWHYSWGDQMWAKLKDQDYAFYSVAPSHQDQKILVPGSISFSGINKTA